MTGDGISLTEPPLSEPLVALAPDAQAMGQLGAALAPVLRPGDTVLLGGDLGAGKTTFTKGLARALGASGPVTSPTFMLLHSYPTAYGWDLLHADVWRLEQLHEVVDLAIPELVEEGAAAVVEWGERAAPALGRDRLHIEIDFDELQPAGGSSDGAGSPGADGVRRVLFTAHGAAWELRMGELARLLQTTGWA
jgi:tRNA threonylcarbamoyladenosine biosynthesis protein TsaE